MARKRKEGRKGAVALSYNPEMGEAPKVTAKGYGGIADRIIALAREHGIPVREDPDLLETLSSLDVEQEIPAELYTVIAEVLSWVYQVNGDYGAVKKKR